VKSIVAVVAGVVVVRLVVDVLVDFLADPVFALASFVSDVVVVFVFGALDPFAAVVALGAFVTFAVVFVVLGDGVALGAFGAFGDDTFGGAGPFPFAAAASGASIRHRTIAVPPVILTLRMGLPSLPHGATEVPDHPRSAGGRKPH